MKKVIVAGSLNVDLTIEVDKMPVQGETIHGHDYFVNEGGKGGNQAIAAVKSAADTIFIGSVGKDVFGKQVLDSLEKFHISTRCIQIHEDVSTGTAMIIRENNDNRIILNPGANYAMKFEFAKEQLDKVASEGDIFITQFENDLDATFKLIEYAKSLKMKTILNPAPAKKIPDEVYKYIDLLVINQSECEVICGIYPNNDEECLKAAEVLKDKGASNIIITLGKEGSLTITNKENIRVNAHKVQAVDSTAAGDSFIGAMAAKLSRGTSLKESIEYATKVSAVTVTRKGAQISIPTEKEVNEFFNNI
ncbi:ribokinase [Clostridium cadaveris]|uniref:ribokinase n=1 Tax=Clostridium cadaveris TaxID=1529 RepID=UPI001459BFF5|nr:ribokinase [Clostridium cadaveris]NME65484.1 ribokinase [Clostridium cadaveris]